MTPRRAPRLAPALFLLAVAVSLARPAPAAAPAAVVVVPVANLLARPSAAAPVEDQAILGDFVESAREEGGYAWVRLASGSRGWIAVDALRPAPVTPPGEPVEVTSSFAHVYREPDFTTSAPVATNSPTTSSRLVTMVQPA